MKSKMVTKNRDIDAMIARGKPDHTHPGPHEDEMRRFDGAITPRAMEAHDKINSDFVDSLVDKYRSTPLKG